MYEILFGLKSNMIENSPFCAGCFKRSVLMDYIYPGKPWMDTDGNRIEAHGGSVFYENGVYYWYGEDKSHTSKKGKIWTWGVRCYSSTDLCAWKDEGHIIPPEPENRKSVLYPNRRLDRPHIIKNRKTGKYVCWLKYNDKSHFAVLTADNLLGPYFLVNAFLQPYGRKAGDFDLAVDAETNTAYLYVELDHKDVIVCRLNEDFTDVTEEKSVIYTGLNPPFSREGVTHFAHRGKHYILTSGMIGYVPNPSEAAVSDDWMGPFTVLGDPHVNDTSSASFNSQISCAFQVAGTEQIITMADRWVPDYVMTKERYDSFVRAINSRYNKAVKASFKDMVDMMTSPMMGSADTSKANYVWLPVTWDGEMPQIEWHDRWTPQDYMK